MRYLRTALALLACAPAVAQAAADFTVPPGFSAQVVAGPPLVERPVMAAFDDRGRLFVADNAGLNLDDKAFDAQLPNLVRMLEDTNGDGVFDKSTVFADKMTFPQGALWYRGALFVASPPNIWRLEDTDGDGHADRRDIVASGFQYNGNAADVHGPFLHPGGRIFWCHGRKGHDVHQLDGTLASKGRGARVWSVNPDGTDIRVFAGGGMDNPVALTFTPEGEILGDANLFHGDPRGDTLIHWIHGGVYPRLDQEAVLAEFPRTGPPLSEIFNFGHVAVSGLTQLRSTGLGYKDGVLVTVFNTGKVLRATLKPRGATFEARVDDFFAVHDPDAHLTDVVEDADGSVLVVNTGGWFRRGCPASGEAKPEATGEIYRVRKTPPDADPRGLKIAWTTAPPTELAAYLADTRFAVRERAVDTLALRGPATIPALTAAVARGAALAKQNAIWALTRNGSPQALRVIRTALADRDERVAQTACNSVITTGDPDAWSALVPLLRLGGPTLRRTAAAALGRTGHIEAIAPLIAALGQPADRFTEHALVYALIELNNFDRTRRALNPADPLRTARLLTALDQMRSSRLDANTVLPLVTARSSVVADVAREILGRRPAWTAAVRVQADRWLDGKTVSRPVVRTLVAVLPRHLANPGIQDVVGRMLAHRDPAIVEAAFEIVGRAPEVSLPTGWLGPFQRALGGTDQKLIGTAVEAAKRVKDERLVAALRRLVADPDRAPGLRLGALAAAVHAGAQVDQSGFTLLLNLLTTRTVPPNAPAAAGFVGQVSLDAAQLKTLASTLRQVGPVERPLLLKAFTRSRDKDVGMALVDVLTETDSLPGITADALTELFKAYAPEVRTAAQPAVDRFRAQTNGQKARLLELEKALATGDATKGAEIYRSGKGACITCHQIGPLGHSVGPNLSHVGKIRAPRDLLESVLTPSATIAQGFEPFVVETTSGDVRFGLVRRETADALYLVDAAGETAIPRAQVKSVSPAPASLMPEGLDLALGNDDLLNLLAFLRSLQ